MAPWISEKNSVLHLCGLFVGAELQNMELPPMYLEEKFKDFYVSHCFFNILAPGVESLFLEKDSVTCGL